MGNKASKNKTKDGLPQYAEEHIESEDKPIFKKAIKIAG